MGFEARQGALLGCRQYNWTDNLSVRFGSDQLKRVTAL